MTTKQWLGDVIVDVIALLVIGGLIFVGKVSAEAGLPVIVALLGVKTGVAIKGGGSASVGRGGGVASIVALLLGGAVATTAATLPKKAAEADASGQHDTSAE